MSSFHFPPVPPSLNSTCVTSTHSPSISLPTPPSLCSTERATDPLGGQINSPVRAAQSAEGPGCSAQTTSPATLSHIIQTARTHIHHLHSLSEYALPVQKHLNIFFSLSSLTPTPLAHLFLKWLLMFFVGRRRIWENHDPPFQSMRIVLVRSLPFSLHCAGHYNRLVFTKTR